MRTSFLYDPATERVQENLTLAEIEAALKDPKKLLWIDMEDPAAEDYSLLDDPFRFHPLLIADCITPQNSPKVDDMEDYIFLVLHSVYYYVTKREEQALDIREIDIFAGPNYILTIHQGHIKTVTVNREICRKSSKLLNHGASTLLYRLLDTMVNNYIEIINTLTDRMDTLEDEILAGRRPVMLPRILSMKKNVMTMRKVLLPQTELFYQICQGKISFISGDAIMYFKDIYDHFTRVSELVGNLREMGESLLEAHHSSQTSRLNSVMKVLTLIMTIMMPMTLIAGIGGMNVQFPLSLRETIEGFWILMGVMMAGGILLLLWFRKIKLL
jgi:magnesium transporter